MEICNWLNTFTWYLYFLIPVIDEIVENIMNINFVSTLNLISGYFQISTEPEVIAKTAFIIKHGYFAFKRMRFGLYGTTSTLQKTLQST